MLNAAGDAGDTQGFPEQNVPLSFKKRRQNLHVHEVSPEELRTESEPFTAVPENLVPLELSFPLTIDRCVVSRRNNNLYGKRSTDFKVAVSLGTRRIPCSRIEGEV